MFKLNIECTKDINELHITFADGTSVVTSGTRNDAPVPSRESTRTKEKEPSEPKTPVTRAKRDEYLDLDADFGGVSQDVVKPPEIQTAARPVNVATELQNLDF